MQHAAGTGVHYPWKNKLKGIASRRYRIMLDPTQQSIPIAVVPPSYPSFRSLSLSVCSRFLFMRRSRIPHREYPSSGPLSFIPLCSLSLSSVPLCLRATASFTPEREGEKEKESVRSSVAIPMPMHEPFNDLTPCAINHPDQLARGNIDEKNQPVRIDNVLPLLFPPPLPSSFSSFFVEQTQSGKRCISVLTG